MKISKQLWYDIPDTFATYEQKLFRDFNSKSFTIGVFLYDWYDEDTEWYKHNYQSYCINI